MITNAPAGARHRVSRPREYPSDERRRQASCARRAAGRGGVSRGEVSFMAVTQ